MITSCSSVAFYNCNQNITKSECKNENENKEMWLFKRTKCEKKETFKYVKYMCIIFCKSDRQTNGQMINIIDAYK